MSDCGEEIIDRLPSHSNLRKENNPGRKVIMNTVGEWLDHVDNENFLEMFFLQEATGRYLDLFGDELNLPRQIDESDDDYRKRLTFESIGHLTTVFLKEVYDVELYSAVNDFNVQNTLISDNTYICDGVFLGVCDETTQQILNKKFVLGSDVKWV